MHFIALLVAIVAVILFAVDHYVPRRFISLGLVALTVAWILASILTGSEVTIGNGG